MVWIPETRVCGLLNYKSLLFGIKTQLYSLLQKPILTTNLYKSWFRRKTIEVKLGVQVPRITTIKDSETPPKTPCFMERTKG